MTELYTGMVRLAIGVLTLLGGAFWLVMALTMPDVRDVTISVAAVGAGLIVLFWDRLRLPARIVVPVAAAGGLAGTGTGLAADRISEGGMFAWLEYRGWPFEWLVRGGVADTPDEARRLAIEDGWAADWLRMLVDVVLWTYASLVLIVVLIVGMRALRGYFAPKVTDQPG
ncbi:hypothetical protein AMIS_74240 [Actinoplanes missouriensis 431]|uniref:Uncharacterized protein n=1 Tax=Actinoplanes missouriensis (strain ATCC 14538 / DSM 43046 / CBS 188.64 / JCM 3121 / NBRC 102363 / NCIMB 12654 / NRRL B-3342 / UNCC 431) TaxID=512565 RepID=I0HI07_ACTM4|nr:hypothetical protein [Actinoplanes missouriensis]BAL92644.1 hypothetical protein AMIS_74240 [Actinoplanes missouriensis 431]